MCNILTTRIVSFLLNPSTLIVSKPYKWRLKAVWHRMLYGNSGRQRVNSVATSPCSLSSWFTPSCTHHLITVTTFALIISRLINSLDLLLQTKNSSISQIIPSSALVPSGRASQNWTQRGNVHRLFILVFLLYFYFALWLCYTKLTTPYFYLLAIRWECK